MTSSTMAAPRADRKTTGWWRRLSVAAVVHWRRVPRPARQICAAVVGGSVLVAGVALIVLPGPAVLVIPLGFAILATEFVWARKLLDRAKARVLRLRGAALAYMRAGSKRSPAPGAPGS